ncbi:B24 [Murid betaherpesvirus 8]|uniref:B24 n=2 Tax=Rat cytomegalovirus (isolate England) TaxID=1261657 RepID=K7Y9Y3_RCMVE|nr:E24 [Murid betaherpesvirus 8]AKE44199.1 a24 [Rat cytomegalovirus ALL-03]AFX83344.1 E24 [Murid betaherpesvirus 8]AKB93224.1 B24 [Murid betaherpesvirus 8]WEG71816.1 tegument protein UL24 [Murid betaherpesvirus 8]WPH24939.1 B24 [Murid betaherpesvirus 8]
MAVSKCIIDSSSSENEESDSEKERLIVDVLRDIANAATKSTEHIKRKVLELAGTVHRIPWPAGATLTIVPHIEGWENKPGYRSRILMYSCCEVNVYPIGYVKGIRNAGDLVFLVDVLGRFYCYSDPPDDAVYLLSGSAEEFFVLGFRYFYPIHCTAGPIDVGMVLSRLWVTIRHGGDSQTIFRFVVRGHGETVSVGRRMLGSREKLRICSLGCLRWHRKGGDGRKLMDAPCPSCEDAIVPLGRVRHRPDDKFGVPVFVGVPTGRVYAGDLELGVYVLVAKSVPGFACLGLSRFFTNKRFGRREGNERKEPPEKCPPCLAEL